MFKGRKKGLQFSNDTYDNGEWPQVFTETVMVPVPKKNNPKNRNEYRTINLI